MREKLTGAHGATKVMLTPQAKRMLTLDVTNCPHCGSHHASLDAVYADKVLAVRCPALGGKPLFIRLTITPRLKR
jgi:hypothetical protein